MPSVPDRSARSTPETTAVLRDVCHAEGLRHAAPVLANVRMTLADLANVAALDGLDPRSRLQQARDDLVRAIDAALVDEMARWPVPQ